MPLCCINCKNVMFGVEDLPMIVGPKDEDDNQEFDTLCWACYDKFKKAWADNKLLRSYKRKVK